jgi:hypothetical protein
MFTRKHLRQAEEERTKLYYAGAEVYQQLIRELETADPEQRPELLRKVSELITIMNANHDYLV